MPHGLEYVVRPYQSPGSHGAIIIPSTPRGTREIARVTWGAKATMPPVEATDNQQNVTCCGEQLTEQTRRSETVRITQPGNSANYVDVARAVEVKLKKKTKDKCAGDWNQMSYVAASIDAIFDDLSADMGFESSTEDGHHCGAIWKLSNLAAG